MKRFFILLILSVVLFAGLSDTINAAAPAVAVKELKCEYRVNPLGIDVVKPRLSWILESAIRGQRQTAWRLLVAGTPENLKTSTGDIWDSGKVDSGESVNVEYNGKALESGMSCWWKVMVWDKEGKPSAWSEPAQWTMGLLRKEDWKAEWIGADWIQNNTGTLPLLRKTFSLDEIPESAFTYVAAIGYYELYINGKKVDDYVLTPGTSDLKKRVLYLTHDVAGYLKTGENVIALWLGRGWCTRLLSKVTSEGLLVMAQVEMKDKSGRSRQIVTDGTWKMKPSLITPIDTGTRGGFGGECCDARKEIPDWNTVSFNDSDWKPAKVFHPELDKIVAQRSQPDRIQDRITPASVKEIGSKEFLIDMGKNFSGWFEIKLRNGAAGDTVRMEYGDKLFPDGMIQSYSQRDAYVFRGSGEERFRMRFNYHAFRWVRISGLSYTPLLSDITGFKIHTGYERVGEFSSSNELLNRIFETVLHTYESLTLGSYVVDCPTRERCGYGGDAGTSMETGMHGFDVSAFYTKWLDDWKDTQDANGQVTAIAPFSGSAGGGPAWGGFVVTLPWQLYLHYGDRRILEDSYPMIRKWMEFLESKTDNGILKPYIEIGQNSLRWSFLGDWVPPGRNQGNNRIDEHTTLFFNNLYCLYNIKVAERVASVLGKKEDAAMYRKRAEERKPLLHKEFFDAASNTYANGEQPYLAMPLLFGVTPEALSERVMDSLERDIMITREGHLNTGMHGTYFMVKYLLGRSRNDLIYEMVNKKTYPGWGYMLENGATTIWEEWNGDNSQIHDTHLSIGSWFINGPGGIRYDESNPGFRNIIIKPAILEDLEHAEASYRSHYGRIRSSWRSSGNEVHLEITIPVNSTATVYIPAENESVVTEGGVSAARADGVRFVRMENGLAVFQVESGVYSFDSGTSR